MEQNFACCTTCGVSGPQQSIWRGRCGDCYKRWVDTRPVGMGAQCGVCTERRRENLRLMELFGRSQVLCYNCAARALKIQPMPRTLLAMRERLDRDRRAIEQRERPLELGIDRRFEDRRLSGDDDLPWLQDDDLVVEMELDGAAGEETDDPTLIRHEFTAQVS